MAKIRKKKVHGRPLEGMHLMAPGSMRKATWREPNQEDGSAFLHTLQNMDPTSLIRAAEHVAYYLDVTLEKAQEFFINWNKEMAA